MIAYLEYVGAILVILQQSLGKLGHLADLLHVVLHDIVHAHLKDKHIWILKTFLFLFATLTCARCKDSLNLSSACLISLSVTVLPPCCFLFLQS